MTKPFMTPLAWALLIGLALIWGSSFLTTSTLVEALAPLHVVTHRVLWAAAALWLYVLVRRLPLPRDRGTLLALIVMGAANNALPFALQAYAQTSIESGLAGILNATTALFGPLVAALVLADEKLTAPKLTGVTLGFAGVVLVIGPAALTRFDLRSAAQLAMLGSTLSYALSAAWARKRLGHLRPEVAATGMLTGAALILVPLSWAMVGPLPLALPAATWAALGYYSLVVTALAYLIYYPLIRIAGAGNATLVTLAVAPVAVGLGALIRAEALPPSDFAGFALIALGLAVIDGRMLRRWRRQQSGLPVPDRD